MDEEKKLNENVLPELPDPKQELLEAPDQTAPAASEPEAAAKPEEQAAPVEASAEEEKASEDARQAAIDEMEKASQKALEAMREAGNEQNEEVVNEAEKKLEDIFTQLEDWLKTNTQPERIKAEMKTAANKVNDLLEKTRTSVINVAESEQFKKTMESGHEFLIGAGSMIADGLHYGYDKLMEVPEFKKAAQFVDNRVDDLRRNEALKTFVDRSEEGLSRLNESIFSGLKSFFDPQKKEDLPDLPEQENQTEDKKE